MTPEENKAIRRRYFQEAWIEKDETAYERYISPDVVDNGVKTTGMGGPPSGIEGVKQRHAATFAALPDCEYIVHDMVAEGDKLSTRFTITGTHVGEYMGVPGTGKRLAFSGIDIVRMQDGKLMEHWVEVDLLGLLQQLGLVKWPPGPGGA
jgi:predicted ester cyclase